MQALRNTIRELASHDCSVVILGENGTGKELVARALHRLSDRAQGPFVAVNCGAIAETMAESEFFGHERGAFTGATNQHRGYFEQAHGGVIFLDEVAELAPALQVKLLRVLQQKEVTRVGSNTTCRPIPVDVRVIAATNKNLSEEVNAGRFREDLYWRLMGFEITVPPLRERGRDVVELFQSFLTKSAPSTSMTHTAEEVLVRYLWPGNVRQLLAVANRARIRSKGNKIGPEHLDLKDLPPEQQSNSRPRHERILEVIYRQGTASRSELSPATGMTSIITLKTLRKMVKVGLLVGIGNGRNTRYGRPEQNALHEEAPLTAR